ncbi:hypothetical protein [Shinella sp.]|uniref:hypothetical protein n=1 Tax=Shinella sp. TaxID=1870904 RepID=UPI0039E48F4F
MTKISDDPLQTIQYEVQRLLGQCLLQLQQYERLIKVIVAYRELSGPESVQAKRVAANKYNMLGNLVGDLLKSFLVTDEIARSHQDKLGVKSDIDSFNYRMQIGFSKEDIEKTESELKELVNLRNNLVHHFIDQHDLHDFDGCRNAQEALVAASNRIEQNFKRLREWAEDMERCRQIMWEMVQSDQFRDRVVKGTP